MTTMSALRKRSNLGIKKLQHKRDLAREMPPQRLCCDICRHIKNMKYLI